MLLIGLAFILTFVPPLHEQLNAWWDDVSSEESSDLCAWNFGTFSTSAGTRWNVQLGSATTTVKNYYLQQQWLLSGICALAGP